MPSRMQKDKDRKAQIPVVDKHEKYSFKPIVGPLVTAEDFKSK